MENLLLLSFVFLIGWLWLDSLRAREIALGICSAACARRGLQLLDQTIALRRLSLHWTRSGIKIRRAYHFEYSEEGVGRHTGQLVLIGQDLVDIGFGLCASPT